MAAPVVKKDEEKPHISIVICGHVDAGKSTTTGRLIFELGGIPERELEKLKAEANAVGKSSFYFAFYMDRQKEERQRGVTITCCTKEFFTPNWHYTIIDAPGHRDFIKNMITGASQADVALLMVPADGNFTAAIARGNHKVGEIQGQTRQHGRLIFLLGVKQLIVCVNKMDVEHMNIPFSEERYKEIATEMSSLLEKVGWKKEFVRDSVPIIPISGWLGDNLKVKSERMPWWKGMDVKRLDDKVVHVDTLFDALDKLAMLPQRDEKAAMRMPISGVYKLKGVGDVLTGRIEQGVVKVPEEVVFIPQHQPSTPCMGKIFSVEMHHRRLDQGCPGDNVGVNVKGLVKDNMPQTGNIMIYKKDQSLRQCKKFVARVMVLDIPGELKPGYCPVAFVRTGHSSCRVIKLLWKKGKETGGKQADAPASLKSNEQAEIEFEPLTPFVVDVFENCEGLSRIALMEGSSVVMLGKIMSVEYKDLK